MEFRVLGPLEVIGPDGRVRIASERQRSILALLILSIGETVSAARLIDELWGDDPSRSARHALVVYLSRLRQAIGPGHIATEPGGYRLRAEGHLVDLAQFERLSGDGRDAIAAGDPRTAAAQFAAALALWRGPALGDLSAERGLQAEQMRLNELRTAVRLQRIDADLACGRQGELVPELRRLVAEMPHREELQARLMLALYRSSRQADALDVYHAARTVLDDDLGVEPGSELDAMQRAILLHDPSLSLAPATGSEPPPASSVGIQAPDVGMSESEIATPRRPVGDTEPSRTHRSRTNVRRTITTVRMNISGSTTSGGRLDLESAHLPVERGIQEVRAILEGHGGTVEELPGDGVMAIFGIPRVHEDDALRAVRAAAETRSALGALNEGLRELGMRIELRAGINTGEVMTDRAFGSSVKVTGEAVGGATSLEQAAQPGEILLAEGTYNLVRWAVEAEPASGIEPNGRSGVTSAFRLHAVVPGLGGHAQGFDSPLVGRARELRQLEAAFEQTLADETCQLFSLLGPAGIGKSRLVHEFLQAVRPEALVVRGRCPPYGERVALWPVAETVSQAAGITAADTAGAIHGKIAAVLGGDERASAIAEHVAAIVGVSEASSTSEETSWAVRRFFEAIARARPLVIVLDDMQWAEPSLLDLIESIADTARGSPILLLCIARLEFLDERPGWAGGMLNAASLLLKPLAEAEVSQLVANLLDGSGVSPTVVQTIVEAAAGNPLFVEEFLAMLRNDAVIRRSGDEWVATTDLAMISTPASIMALLAARLDRLPNDEREVLECASVVGEVFTREAVEALVEKDDLPAVPRWLEVLVHKEIIRPDRSSPEAADAYRFKHTLIRDTAYAGLPKRQRIVLHERLADWLALTTQDGRRPGAEVIGAHYEQAHRYRITLGPLDERARTVGRLAATLLAEIGRRARVRGDYRAAADSLSRASALLSAWDRERLVIVADMVEALLGLGDFAATRQTNDELMKHAAAMGFEDLRWRATLYRISLDFSVARDASPRASEDLRTAIRIFQGAGDDQRLGWAWFLLGQVEEDAGHDVPRGVAFAHALEHARRAGDVSLEAYSLASTIDLDGPATVGAGMRAAHELLEWARASSLLWAEGMALAFLARLKAMVGEFEEARRLLESAVAIYRDLNLPYIETDVARWIGLIEWLAEDPVAAERGLRPGYETLERLGETKARAFIAAELARMLYLQARYDEALDFTKIAEKVSSSLSAWTDIGWRGVRGMIVARRGDGAAGLALGREDVARAGTTDLLMVRARAFEDLAEVFELSGHPNEAQPLLAQAIGLYERKGITVLAARTRRRLAISARP